MTKEMQEMDRITNEFFEVLDEIVTTKETVSEAVGYGWPIKWEWTPEDQLNADICEATDGMLSLSHV